VGSASVATRFIEVHALRKSWNACATCSPSFCDIVGYVVEMLFQLLELLLNVVELAARYLTLR
jgi:hypothetical protein